MIAIGRSIFQYLAGAIATVFTLAIVLSIGMALAARLLHLDLEPYILQSARLMSGGRLIDFEEAFVADPSSGLRVCEVSRVDTDGDGFREWLVYYQFDLVGEENWRQPCPDRSPRAAAIYDNDRGEPAVLFPYKLQPPDRDYLGEQGVHLQMYEIVPNFNVSQTDPIPELLFFGAGSGTNNQLTIFKYQENTAPWDSPTNDVPRYQVIGSFTGSGGVSFNEQSQEVTVLDRGHFDRSQLAIKNVYKLHGEENNKTYMTEIGAASLSAPVWSTIDFGVNPPTDIFNSEFPEKIVLGFYQSLDSGLGRGWESGNFLAPNSEAALKLKANDWQYFGLPGQGNISGLAVVQLEYFPEAELVSASDTIEGPQPRVSQVAIKASTTQNDQRFETALTTYELVFLNGQWKINKRIF